MLAHHTTFRVLAPEHMEPTPGDTAPVVALALMGRYHLGWNVLRVGPCSASAPNTIYRITIGDRVVEAVAQTHSMFIYVNLDEGGCDEWDTPPRSGTILMVGTPHWLQANKRT